MTHKETQDLSDEPLLVAVQQSDTQVLVDGDFFSLSGSDTKSRSLKVMDGGNTSQEWLAKQENALAEYRVSHEKFEISSDMHNHYKLFGAYIGNALCNTFEKKRPAMLDVGCGIGVNIPLYMKRVRQPLQYIGLDAIDINMTRDYPFICSTIESLGKLSSFHQKFDAFIFGTSLDHFEDIAAVADAVKAVSAPGAIIIFWIGLHDSEYAGVEEGARLFGHTFKGRITARPLLRFARLALWDFPRLYLTLRLRDAKLQRGKKLDDLHFWYFRDKDIPALMAQFGEVEDISYVPGGGSVFITCRVKP